MTHATHLVIERGQKTYAITLRHPMALADIYYHFVARNHRPLFVSLSNGVARVTF